MKIMKFTLISLVCSHITSTNTNSNSFVVGLNWIYTLSPMFIAFVLIVPFTVTVGVDGSVVPVV
jgi:hypothetical protein